MSDITTTAADYEWLEEQYEDLMEAYCVTLVEGLTPEGLLQALGAEPGERITGVDGLGQASLDAYDDDQMLVAAVSLGGWSLMVEYNGYLGVTDKVMLPISRGRTVVSHFCNVNGVDSFCWYRDGDVRLYFEPLFAYYRDGSHPDELLTEMRESGFDLSEEDDNDYDGHTEAAFALAHRITGIRITPELFASAEFMCGLAPRP
jgi:uncharacterized protein DUF6461